MGITTKLSNVYRVVGGFAAAGLLAFAAVPAMAAEEYGGGSVQSYSAATPLESGVIVRMVDSGAKKVDRATQSQPGEMFGVTVDRNSLSVTLTSEGLENEVFVAVSGTYNVLVSTQGGSIAAGDYVKLSSVNGVAMKAGTEEARVFGRAAAAFDGKSATLGSTTLKDDAGGSRTVQLGSIPVTIDIRGNPNVKSTKVNVPEPLERIGQAIAEKEVNPIRIYLSLGITVLSIIIAVVILYAGIRNGVVSIGRNPMSKKSIFRALLEVILTSILVIVIGLAAVYLLLKL